MNFYWYIDRTIAIRLFPEQCERKCHENRLLLPFGNEFTEFALQRNPEKRDLTKLYNALRRTTMVKIATPVVGQLLGSIDTKICMKT